MTTAETGFFKLEGKFAFAGATHDFARVITTLPTTLGRAKNADTDYVHIGDCKSISKKNAQIHYDGSRGLFLLTVLGKNRVIVNGKNVVSGDAPVPLLNKTAIRMGSAVSDDNSSKFYFLLPLVEPKDGTAQLVVEVAREMERAGIGHEITTRLVTEQLQLKYPFYASAVQTKLLTRKVYSFMCVWPPARFV